MDWGFFTIMLLAILGAALIVGGTVAYRGSSRVRVRSFAAGGIAARIIMWVIVVMVAPVSVSSRDSPEPEVTKALVSGG